MFSSRGEGILYIYIWKFKYIYIYIYPPSVEKALCVCVCVCISNYVPLYLLYTYDLILLYAVLILRREIVEESVACT